MSVLEVRDLQVHRDHRAVVAAVNLTLGAGEVLGVIGPNGAGKSTLVQTLAGLLAPSAGTLALDGRALADWPAAARARVVGYLPQQGQVHWPLTVAELVALGRLPHQRGWGGLDPAGAQAVAAALTATDCTDLAARPVTALSGGERQRVLLARVLAGQPSLLLADEPVTGLDPGHQLAWLQLLRQQAAEGLAAVVVLHDLALAARACDRLLLLDRGRPVVSGTPAEVLQARWLEPVYGVRFWIDCRNDAVTVQPTQPLPR